MTKEEMIKYYERIEVTVSGAEIREISKNAYNLLRTMACKDFTDNVLRTRKEFLSDTEFRIYLMCIVDCLNDYKRQLEFAKAKKEKE